MQATAIPITIHERTFTHLLEDEHLWAIRAAVGAERPLLVLGEPGVGKSQLALAAASHLNRPLIRFTVDSNTEATDLLYRYDAVRRLAEAQVVGSAEKTIQKANDDDGSKKESEPRKRNPTQDPLAIDRFVTPGPLWWALDWNTAVAKAPAAKPEHELTGWEEHMGVVILIDEIDKADAHVPNGLLEVLGENRFLPLGRDTPIQLKKNHRAPLVVITSNEDRVLPPAFVRRCVVLKIELPGGSIRELDADPSTLVAYLERLGEVHFQGEFATNVDGQSVYRQIAQQLTRDRQRAIQQSLRPYPGPAEYLDILRAIQQIKQAIQDKPREFPEFAQMPSDEIAIHLADKLSAFVFRKSSLRSE
jgi:MoxR-like ATPase